MKLYWSDVLAPRKVCAVAKYLESPVDYAYLDLSRGEHRKPHYLALNPNGKVPTLVDGNRVLWEADAIMCHLAARCDSELWPQDARQIDVIRWFSWNAQHFNINAGTLYFEHVIKSRFGIGEADPVAVRRATEDWRRYAKILDDHLRDRHWLVGESLTVADFSVAVALPYAERACIPLDAFPAVRRWHERLSELDAWREPFPELAMAD
ncbi:MAG: glutathione S-transferase family protein [Rhodanobacter sp.]